MWFAGRQKNIRVLLLVVLSIAALPGITALIYRPEALTFSTIILFVAGLLSLKRISLAERNMVVRVLIRLLPFSLFTSAMMAGLAVFQEQYPFYYYNAVRGALLFVILAIGLVVLSRSLKK